MTAEYHLVGLTCQGMMNITHTSREMLASADSNCVAGKYCS